MASMQHQKKHNSVFHLEPNLGARHCSGSHGENDVMHTVANHCGIAGRKTFRGTLIGRGCYLFDHRSLDGQPIFVLRVCSASEDSFVTAYPPHQ